VEEYRAALAFCQGKAADGVMAGHRIERALASGASGGELWAQEKPGARRPGQSLRAEDLVAVVWAGGSLMPVGGGGTEAKGFAAMARQRGNRYVSMVGDAAAVAGLWAELSATWPRLRAYRQTQPLMAIETRPRGLADEMVVPARREMLDAMVPACRAMFTEELGFPPPGPEAGYRAHIGTQIERGAILTRINPSNGEVIFKAELGASCGQWVQVQGVWTNPAYRGRGIAKAAMAAVVTYARQRGWTGVCLYVNDFNAPALAVYRAVGFIQVGTWATVMV
jgi:predicted GNAT family acetyltransferase